MSQSDSVCTEKTCLTHIYDTSVCDKHTFSSYMLDTHKLSSFYSCGILSLNSTYD